jgi:hypothetical protein
MQPAWIDSLCAMEIILSCSTFSTSLALRSARYSARACTPLGASTTRPLGRRRLLLLLLLLLPPPPPLLLLLLLLLLLGTDAMLNDFAPTVLSVSLPSMPLMWKGSDGATAAATATDAVATEAMPTVAPVLLAAAALRASLLDTWRCNLCRTAAKHMSSTCKISVSLWFLAAVQALVPLGYRYHLLSSAGCHSKSDTERGATRY